MYDVPGMEAETDRLWATIRDALRAEGIASPDAVSRGGDLASQWTAPDLVLSQTCGLPLVTGRAGAATVLGAFDFDLPLCPPGHYNSVVIKRKGSDLGAAVRFAYNEAGSQSGYNVVRMTWAQPLHVHLETGSHFASLRAVASGDADIAALDAVSWRLAETLTTERCQVEVLEYTTPTPGLPLITAPGREPGPYRRAVAAAVDAFAGTPNKLGLRGFVAFDLDDYTAAIRPAD